MIEPLVTGSVTILILITGFNLLTSRSLKSAGAVTSSVSILIPMRDEVRNARECIETALAQDGLANFQVRVIDDCSTDGTLNILREVTDSHFAFREGTPPPAGWLGKNYALHSLASGIKSDYLVFMDADVRLNPRAIAAAITRMEARHLDYLSAYPRQVAQSWLERLVQPLLQWSWFATLPLIVAERSLRSSTVVANGQLFVVRTEAYRRCGGHESVRSEVLDDMELARSLRRSGSRGTVVDASGLASCRMYENAAELKNGYLKSQWRAFGGILGALVAIKIMFWTSIAPILLAITGWRGGWYCYLALVISRLAVAIRTKSSLLSSWFHPIAIAIWIYLIIASIWRKRIGELTWRGRAI